MDEVVRKIVDLSICRGVSWLVVLFWIFSLKAGAKAEKHHDEDEDLGPAEGPRFKKRPQNQTCLEGNTGVIINSLDDCLLFIHCWTCFIAGDSAEIEFTIEAATMPNIKFVKGKREIKPTNKVSWWTQPNILG